MNIEIIVRQVENGVIINESLIKEMKVSKPKSMALLHESDFGHNTPFPKTWVMQCAQKLVCQSQTFCLKVGT